MMKLKITVMPKEPLDNEKWYRTAQTAARLAMMLRKVSFTYRNNYQMLLPGFTPNVGDAFGQKKVGTMAPGLDFAFGLVDDSYIGKARDNDWLLCNDSMARATMSRGARLRRSSYFSMKLSPLGRRKMPPYPRIASVMRNAGWVSPG
jgi:cell surface protein SprA